MIYEETFFREKKKGGIKRVIIIIIEKRGMGIKVRNAEGLRCISLLLHLSFLFFFVFVLLWPCKSKQSSDLIAVSLWDRMKSLGWPPDFVAKCQVSLFEASGGSMSWRPSSTVGELHMKALGNSMLRFELYDLLDSQILFEHTMHKPDSFVILAPRFFAIRLENGSFRGLGFKEKAAADEMKGEIESAVKPFSVCNQMQEAEITKRLPMPPVPSSSLLTMSTKKPPEVRSYESIPKSRSLIATPKQLNEQLASSSPVQPPELNTFTPAKTRRFRLRWRVLVKSLSSFSHTFGFKEHEMEIGYPTDVKHVAHIGWDGPTVNEHSWLDELRPAPDFSSGPLREFGQPKGPDWICDALFAAKWTSPGLSEGCQLPPAPPAEFQERLSDKDSSGKPKDKKPKQKPRQRKSYHI